MKGFTFQVKYTHTHTHTYTHTHTHTHSHTHTHCSMYVCMYVCTYVYTHTRWCQKVPILGLYTRQYSLDSRFGPIPYKLVPVCSDTTLPAPLPLLNAFGSFVLQVCQAVTAERVWKSCAPSVSSSQSLLNAFGSLVHQVCHAVTAERVWKSCAPSVSSSHC